MKNKGVLLVISGPSGAGKGTVCDALLDKYPGLHYSVSVTTREPRVGEVEGESYFFVSTEQFETMINDGQLLEHAQVYGNYYGTPRKYVLEKLNQGFDVLLEVDTAGAKQIREKFREGVFVFVAPPSLDDLYKRIKKRGKDSEEVIKKRMQAAPDEIAQAVQYDYIVLNNKVEDAVEQIGAIVLAEKAHVKRNLQVIDKLRYGCSQR